MPSLPLRRTALSLCLLVGAALPQGAQAADLIPLQVAYAGSMRAVMDKGMSPAIKETLGVRLLGRGQVSLKVGSKGAAHPRKAAAFVRWLRGAKGQRILQRFFYDGPGATPPLTR